MLSKNARENIKTGAYIITEIGAGVLLGSIGGIVIKSLPLSKVGKVLALIGWTGISGKVCDVAAEHIEDSIDETFNSLDKIEARVNDKKYKSA